SDRAAISWSSSSSCRDFGPSSSEEASWTGWVILERWVLIWAARLASSIVDSAVSGWRSVGANGPPARRRQDRARRAPSGGGEVVTWAPGSPTGGAARGAG